MVYLPCSADSAIAVCGGPYNRTSKNRAICTATKHFTYAELATATAGFSAVNFLGKGSHGAVYRATLDNGNLIAAVKRMTQLKNPAPPSFRNNLPAAAAAASTPGENEIAILTQVRHPRLVNLIGFCADTDSERQLIVVEYMANGSLYDLLHSGSVRVPGWTKRVRFALQVAKAVEALHASDPPVIHRDIKSSNILIDGGWKARLGDFGLAFRGSVEEARVKCTPPAGTLGYLDPGYLTPADLTSKSDVFSFGILLLEIITGRKAIDVNFSPPSVVDWAVPMIKRSEFDSICDGRISAPANGGVIRSLAVLAARCVRSRAEKRPSMTEVVEGLKAARKRVEAPAIWVLLRRRFGQLRVEEAETEAEGQEAMVGVRTDRKTTRRRRNGKVSNVPVASNCTAAEVGEKKVRSRSIGSSREVENGGAEYYRLVGQDEENNSNCNGGGSGMGMERGGRKLRKSMSTGVLHRRGMGRSNSCGGRSRGIDVSMNRYRLKVGLDEESDKVLEKPLFSIIASN